MALYCFQQTSFNNNGIYRDTHLVQLRLLLTKSMSYDHTACYTKYNNGAMQIHFIQDIFQIYLHCQYKDPYYSLF